MSDVTEARAELGGLSRAHPDNPELLAAARRKLETAKLDASIRKLVDAAPPLTESQKTTLRRILGAAPAGGAGLE